MWASTNNQNLHWQTKSKYPTQTSKGEAISLRAPTMSKGVAMATTTVSATAATMVSTKEKGEVFSDWPLWICLAAAGMEKTKQGQEVILRLLQVLRGDSRQTSWTTFYIYSIVKTMIKNTFGLSEDQ